MACRVQSLDHAQCAKLREIYGSARQVKLFGYANSSFEYEGRRYLSDRTRWREEAMVRLAAVSEVVIGLAMQAGRD